jgi:hypothetical protein
VADRAGPPISEVAGQAMLEGGGREVGRGWAENRKWAKVLEIKSFRTCKLWKHAQGDLDGLLTWGIFIKSSRLLKDF